MAATYDLTTSVGQIRLMIGDTLLAEAVFTDEELTYFIGASTSLYMAAASVLEAWIAKYTTNADSENMGDYSYTQKIVEKLNKLRNDYRQKDESIPYLTWSEWDLTGGSAITAEED